MEVNRADGIDGWTIRIRLSGDELSRLERGEQIEYHDDEIGPDSRNWVALDIARSD
jgi:hypothetical protein